MAKLLFVCSLLSAPFSYGAGVCDEAALAQVAVEAHHGMDPEVPRPEFDGQAIAARIKAEMDAVLNKGKADALMGKKASSLNEMRAEGEHGGMSVGLADAKETLQVDSSHGLILEREEAFVEEGSRVTLDIAHGCNSTDAMGSNNCLIPANDRVRVRLSFKLREPVTQGATLEMNFSTRLYGLSAVIGQHLRGWKTDKLVQDLEDVNATCPLCGGTCKLEVFGKKTSQAMPDCPLAAGAEQTVVDTVLKMPPTAGLKVLRAKYLGGLTLRRADGSVLASARGKVRIGERDMQPCHYILQYLNKCKN